MDAKPLFKETGEKVFISYCGKCGKTWASEVAANECCQVFHCKCGNERSPYQHNCRSCQEKASLLKEKQRVMNAKRVTKPTNDANYVYCEGFGNEGYISWDDIHTECESEGKESPVFIYDCDVQKWEGFNADDLVENYFEDAEWFEDAADQVKATEELETFLKEWNKKQTLEQYWPNDDRIIVLDEKRFNDWLKEEPAVM